MSPREAKTLVQGHQPGTGQHPIIFGTPQSRLLASWPASLLRRKDIEDGRDSTMYTPESLTSLMRKGVSKDTNFKTYAPKTSRITCARCVGRAWRGKAELPWKPWLFLPLSLRLLPPTGFSVSCGGSSPLGPSRARHRLFL